MQSTNVYVGLLRERGKRGLPLKRVYRQLFNRNLYLSAYGKIYRNAGATTKGVTEETVDFGLQLRGAGIAPICRSHPEFDKALDQEILQLSNPGPFLRGQ